ncbi:indole-3-glycerol phosphate synthase [Leuconostoc gelidum subsp. gelidum]|uniref:Indole-3-glycerol phosphate synthase n=1 Tax=Leuconostoc gelidum subsp. gelidum TaxID=1607839 RepID=A0AB35G0C9_LEUGE|nr:indole-3-glycerol phosphate synthase [Leuconostoc gelidum]MBZ5960872.1 indole-3-glycerol phosphate synthase [Leuconostoc gasicomitatum]MBZ5963508.1 indole-3-glycerol phosphate synthase [Leuconostoc gelidum subsp. gelidum]USP18170.1 indole-3-glycerol phosphate synthase [Leuconostoc gelidum subsp. aenigmaticum]MBZ5975650.1 indole-3-glycerol phosphate synthase [Leuconostoc gelidum subsp. gelidum]MBZ5976182.1 indole-3-glycerol phosphate synthase [Leuconostoc gelidum subsp. gelidum]
MSNCNLKNFSINFNNTQRLRDMMPKDILVMSDLSIKTHADTVLLEILQVDDISIDDIFMKRKDKIDMIKSGWDNTCV